MIMVWQQRAVPSQEFTVTPITVMAGVDDAALNRTALPHPSSDSLLSLYPPLNCGEDIRPNFPNGVTGTDPQRKCGRCR